MAFSSQTRITLKLAYFQTSVPMSTEFCTVIYRAPTTLRGWSKICITNPVWRTVAILKNRKITFRAVLFAQYSNKYCKVAKFRLCISFSFQMPGARNCGGFKFSPVGVSAPSFSKSEPEKGYRSYALFRPLWIKEIDQRYFVGQYFSVPN